MINTNKIFNKTILLTLLTAIITLVYYFLVPSNYVEFIYTLTVLAIILLINLSLSFMKKIKPYMLLHINDSIYLGLLYSYLLKIFLNDISEGYVLIVLLCIFLTWLYNNIFIEIKIFYNRKKEIKKQIDDNTYDNDDNKEKKKRKAYLLRYNIINIAFLVIFALFEFLLIEISPVMPFFNIPTMICMPLFILAYAFTKKIMKV